MEWKFTESYLNMRRPNPSYDVRRRERYEADFLDPAGPVRSDVLDFEWLLDEPFYQLMRQQLLAQRLQNDPELAVDRVRVLHVLSPKNSGYQDSLTRPEQQAVGRSVDEVWSKLLRHPESFIHVDPDVFLDPSVSSTEYVDRYSDASGSTATRPEC